MPQVNAHLTLQRVHDSGNNFGTPKSYPDYNHPRPVEVVNDDFVTAEVQAVSQSIREWAEGQPNHGDEYTCIRGLEDAIRKMKANIELRQHK